MKKGEYYIICDLNGGTGVIVAHLVGSNNNLNKIIPSCGGNFGSNKIDKFIFKDIYWISNKNKKSVIIQFYKTKKSKSNFYF